MDIKIGKGKLFEVGYEDASNAALIKGIIENLEEYCLDYRWLPGCQYPVADPRSPEGESDCAQTAVVRAWWKEDESDEMLLCEEHLKKVIEVEIEYDKDLLRLQEAYRSGLDRQCEGNVPADRGG